MVRIIASVTAVVLATQAIAFTPNAINSVRFSASELSMGKMQEARSTISNLNKENFSASLAEVEPYLLNDAGASIYKKSMRRISVSAKSFGVTVPADYAKAAKATEKRREKQNVFIQGKEAEKIAAAEEAAAAVPEVADDASA